MCRINVLQGCSLGNNNFKLFHHHPPKKRKRKESCLKEAESFKTFEVAELRQSWVGFYGVRVQSWKKKLHCISPTVLIRNTGWAQFLTASNIQSDLFISVDFQVLVTCCQEDSRYLYREWKCHQPHSSLPHLWSSWVVRRMCERPWLLSQFCLFLVSSTCWGFLFSC